ncbi:MAG: glycosyl transferase [Rhizobiaceae bacterium]|nr:glycosyl transferase [Rhizobiaceae bacterium]
MNAPRILFYVQHLLGIGHLARASRISSALHRAGANLKLVTGGAPVDGFPPSEIAHVALPPVVASEGFSGLAHPDGSAVDERFLNDRRDLLLSIYSEFQPDIVIVEAFPFGRRQMRFELVPLLEAISQGAPKPLLACSLRDIMQERTKPGRNEETVELVRRYFDLVLVHGDAAFARLEETFPLAGQIADRIAYTGMVAGPAPDAPQERFDILISAGGGAAGRKLVAASVDAAAKMPRDRSISLITGPNLPEADYRHALAAASPNLSVFRFRPDFPDLLSGAKLSVSQAGYNTVCDILRARCRSLLIPFAEGGETEQTSRARRLEALGLASMLSEEKLDGDTLLIAIEGALEQNPPPASTLDLNGAQRTVQILLEHWRVRQSQSA